LQGLITEATNIKLTPRNHGQQFLVFYSKKFEAFVITLSGGNGLVNNIQFLNAIGRIGKRGDKLRAEEIRGLEQAIEIKADIVAAVCPYCLQMFEDAIKAKTVEKLLKAMDVAELLVA